MSRHRGAKPLRRYGRLGAMSLLSPEYLLSVVSGPSTRDRRVTKPCFRICSTRKSHSQVPFCLYALHAISNRAEGTLGRLRYNLGGDRPSQTTRLTLSSIWIHRLELEP